MLTFFVKIQILESRMTFKKGEGNFDTDCFYRASRRKNLILQAAKEVFTNKGFNATTIPDILVFT